MISKKAQGLSINTIILIILGVVVLVALIFGFAKGWEGIKQWISPSNNIAQIKSQCDVACSTENKYDYCYQQRDVKVDSTNIKGTSCYALVREKSEFGINSCSAINCGVYEYVTVAQDPLNVKNACCNNNALKSSGIPTKVWVIDDKPGDNGASPKLSVSEVLCTEDMCSN